ncbi:MAG UNVERIFIED_CONTAM: hypothetical protein LVR18_09425 [Planctomycetaceae bacterium]|jgi:hypothetical protein
MDQNSDGKLSREELPEPLKPLLERFDRNSDGLLDQEELGNVARDRMGAGIPASPAEFAAQMLRRSDANQDGKLSGEEIPPFVRNRLEIHDKNGDGSLDLVEIQQSFMGDRQQIPTPPANESGVVRPRRPEGGPRPEGTERPARRQRPEGADRPESESQERPEEKRKDREAEKPDAEKPERDENYSDKPDSDRKEDGESKDGDKKDGEKEDVKKEDVKKEDVKKEDGEKEDGEKEDGERKMASKATNSCRHPKQRSRFLTPGHSATAQAAHVSYPKLVFAWLLAVRSFNPSLQVVRAESP